MNETGSTSVWYKHSNRCRSDQGWTYLQECFSRFKEFYVGFATTFPGISTFLQSSEKDDYLNTPKDFSLEGTKQSKQFDKI